jgi:hypothetical protein
MPKDNATIDLNNHKLNKYIQGLRRKIRVMKKENLNTKNMKQSDKNISEINKIKMKK